MAWPLADAASPMRRSGSSVVASLYPTALSGSSASIYISCHGARVDIDVLNEAPAEPTLDTEVSLGDGILERRRRLDDLAVRDVQPKRAADAAVGTDGIRRRDRLFVPRALRALVELTLCHQGARGTDGNAVPAVHACRVGQRNGELGGDARLEAAPRDRYRERVLVIGAARFDAFVTEDALCVVAHVQLVIDFRRLSDRRGICGIRRRVMPGDRRVTFARGRSSRRRSKARRPRVVLRDPLVDVRRRRK